MLDQTSRYSDLTLKEEDLIAAGKHVLAAYKMKPAAGFFRLCWHRRAFFVLKAQPAPTWPPLPPMISPKG